jgi:hypothetical protein
LSIGGPVKPGEAFTDTIVLNKWFLLDKPGDYRVRGAYPLHFHQLDEKNLSQHPSMNIWEDQATGEFAIKIIPAQPHTGREAETRENDNDSPLTLMPFGNSPRF